MNNITLISDWKLRDPYVSILKSQLLLHTPDTQIFDISHAVDMFHLVQEAFILKNCYSQFPQKTVHLMLVGTSFNPKANPVIAVYDNHFFIGEDNGIFSLMFGEEKCNYYQHVPATEKTFMEKLVETVALTFAGSIIEKSTTYTLAKKLITHSVCYYPEQKMIVGNISYIDSFCNAVTNIPTELFEKHYQQHKNFEATIALTKHIRTSRYHTFYDMNETEVFLVANRLGFIELTMNQGNIAILADIKINDEIKIQFE